MTAASKYLVKAKTAIEFLRAFTINIVLLHSLLFIGCDFQRQNASSDYTGTAPLLTVNVLKVTRDREIPKSTLFFGKLQPIRQVQMDFGRGGKIKGFLKEVGATVKKGEIIAELEQQDLDLEQQKVAQALLEAKQRFELVEPILQETAQREILQLEAQLEGINSKRAKGLIIAPFDCVVARRNFKSGSIVGPQIPILEIIDPARGGIKANLLRKIAGQLETGESHTVEIDGKKIEAQVRSISPIGSALSSEVFFEITSVDTDVKLSFGETVLVKLTTPSKESGFWLPISSLQRESNGLWTALVVSQNREQNASQIVNRKIVQVVRLSDDWALVEGSLVEGERIVANGTHRIVVGQRVSVNDITGQLSHMERASDR